ncbi:MAG: hypothetical protein JWR72_4060 [Flavisolibacter sp.]|jgi:hypothetical protein|nr:hypothetical protein [Flavisolibacter sp.]
MILLYLADGGTIRPNCVALLYVLIALQQNKTTEAETHRVTQRETFCVHRGSLCSLCY